MKFLIRIVLVGIAVGVGGVFLYVSRPQISYQNSPEVGEEVIVRFAPWVGETAAKDSFHITPEPQGERVWLSQYHELHFLPTDGFVAGGQYQVVVGNAGSIFAAAVNPSHTFVFSSAHAEATSAQKPVAEVPNGKYIDINLATMVLTLIENGQPVNAYPVAGKGNPWIKPTREGTFRVLSKEQNHWSNIYHLWMPLSMNFSGNFFIHGWPYWPDGRRLTSVYSGGCIRLRDEIAQVVFNWAEVGTPVVVHSTPGRFAIFPAQAVENGDLVREISNPNVYVVKFAGEKRFKRHVFTEKFAEWYPHLAPFRAHIKVIPDGALIGYVTSRWVKTSAEAGGYIYEVGAPGIKHLLQCGTGPGDAFTDPTHCQTAWVAYGWDQDELFIAAQAELDSYGAGDTLSLSQAPSVSASQ